MGDVRMRIKVELHRDVVWFVRHRCNDDEVDAFYEKLEKLRAEPIENSEAVSDRRLSRYMLRFFRFKQNIAIFEYNPARNRIRIRKCRRLRPQPRDRGDPGEQARAP